MLLAIVILGAIIIFAGPAACQKMRSMGAQSRVDSAQSGAASNSAADAIGTVARSGEAESASEEVTRSNQRDNRGAQGANDPVNPASRDAGIAALCKRSAYANDPRCRRNP
jgi:hypothetical protein